MLRFDSFEYVLSGRVDRMDARFVCDPHTLAPGEAAVDSYFSEVENASERHFLRTFPDFVVHAVVGT